MGMGRGKREEMMRRSGDGRGEFWIVGVCRLIGYNY